MKNKKINQEKIISLFEIILMISLAISTSYLIHETNNGINSINNNSKINNGLESNLGVILEFVGKILFGSKGLVSALEPSDLQQGSYTCTINKNGSICQPYPASVCESQCIQGGCIPTTPDQVSECKPGTCYDSNEGTCTTGATKGACENGGGEWFNDPNGNIPECKQGCCVLGDNALLSTQQQCNKQSNLLGIKSTFDATKNTQKACWTLSNTQEQGACVLSSGLCKFTTKGNCLQSDAQFYSGILCSNPQLNTSCKKQATIGCSPKKDEVYWFDSCGNQENIYSSNAVNSYNNGLVLNKNQSCSLGSGSNGFANQGTCGNCNYLLGSLCGPKTNTEHLDDKSKDFVCRNVNCIDGNGKTRQNGESWCSYQGDIGVENGIGKLSSDQLTRSVDTVGSSDFRQTCINGNIQTELCDNYRNSICVQSNVATKTGTFSSAACRINGWQTCINYNLQVKSKNNPDGTLTTDQRDEKCSQNPDCFVKTVNLGSGFKFNMCAPKYSPGFDVSTQENGTGALDICSLATQKCTEVWAKDIGGSWSCVANCDCHTSKFSEQMNDLCISLGDCGTKANFVGDVSYNGKVFKGGNKNKLGKDITLKGKGWFSADYITTLKSYANTISGKFIDAGNVSQYFAAIGLPSEINTLTAPTGPSSLSDLVGTASGMAGIGLVSYASMNGGLTALGGATVGGLIGFAAVNMMIKFSGIGPAIGEEGAYALMAAGAVSGSVLAIGLLPGVAGFTTLGLILGPGLAILIVAFVAVEAILGAGETKNITYTFQCQPWQAPLGGAKCSDCGKDGFQCSNYACHSLGQTCQLLNPDTKYATCVNVNPNDVNAPIISPLESALSTGYSYESINDNGYTIKSNNSDGCLGSYQTISFGVLTDEASYCKFDTTHVSTFDDLQFDFGGSNLFITNHTQIFSVPSLDTLVSGYDPNKQADFNLYIRCQDKIGNVNGKDYVINFCVNPGPDLTPPYITGRLPAPLIVPYDATSLNASVFTNEPADCRWDVADKSYDSMSNDLTCDNTIDNSQYSCSTEFPVVGNESVYYIRCLDQPWLVDVNGSWMIQNYNYSDSSGNDVYSYNPAPTGEERNAMQESYQFIIDKSISPLSIDSISPDNVTIKSGVEPVSVNVNVTTSGGAYQGIAECAYDINGQYIDFYNTFSTEHSQVFQSFLAGSKTIDVKCQDAAGNVAYKTANFDIVIDTTPSSITRIYSQSGNLVAVTDEDSQCSFVNYALNGDPCTFDFNNGTMMEGDSLVHTTQFNSNSIYYIKCKDAFGNLPAGCSLVAKGVNINEKTQ